MFRQALQTGLMLGALLSVLGRCVVASAEPNPQPLTPAPLAQARDHFLLGTQLFAAHNYRDALREFQLVAGLAPNAELWFNIGRTHEELGEYDRAARAFERYLRDRVDAKDEASVRAHIADLDSRAQLTREHGELAPNKGSLRIHLESNAALVLLDGQALSPDALAEPLLLPAGRHHLDVSEPSRIPMHAQFDIEPGLLTAAYADLAPMTDARMRPASHTITWSLLGLTAAGLITSATFAALSLADQSDADLRPARSWAQRTDVALAGTAVCALGAVLLYYVEGRNARTELSRAK
jgi:hypothetical protein